MATSSYRGFVRQAPSSNNPTVMVPVRITDMGALDAAWWDTRLGPHHVQIANRADRFWPWAVLLPLCHLLQLSKQRYCRPLVIWARTDSGQYLRVGMSIIIERYPHLDVSNQSEAHFVWFMCAADKEVLRNHFGMSDPPALGAILLDNAMVLSENAQLEGRIGLHAAAAGGSALLAFYRSRGLLPLATQATLPKAVKRSNDGRFFFTDKPTAAALLNALDPDR